MKSNTVALLIIFLVWGSENALAQRQQRGRVTNVVITRAKQYEPLIISAARRHQIDPHLLWTIAYLESRFRNEAVSYKNGQPCAYGLMQFTVPTALRYGLANPHDPQQSIDAAARYVRDLQTRFGPRRDLILAAYNAGEGAVEAFRDGKTLVLRNRVINPRGSRTGGIPPYQETRNYVALGAVVYHALSSVTMFPALNEAPDKPKMSEAFLLDRGLLNSIYSLEIAPDSSIQHIVKSPTKASNALRANSIYAN